MKKRDWKDTRQKKGGRRTREKKRDGKQRAGLIRAISRSGAPVPIPID